MNLLLLETDFLVIKSEFKNIRQTNKLCVICNNLLIDQSNKTETESSFRMGDGFEVRGRIYLIFTASDKA
jgi:hypothetical protein